MRHTNPLVCIAVLLVAIFVTPAHALWPAGPFAPLNLDAPPHHGDGVLATSDDAGGFWASYFAPEGFGRDTTFVRRVDAAGNMPWPPTRIDSRFIHQWPTCIYSDGQGGALVGYDCDGLPAFYV